MKIHKDIATRGFDSSFLMSNVLVSMYGKCKSLVNAHNVFEIMPKQNVVSWIQ